MTNVLSYAKINLVRFNLGLSKRDMASLLGVSRQTYYNWASGGGIKDETDILQRLQDVVRTAGEHDWSAEASTYTTSEQRKRRLLALLNQEQ